MMALEWKIGLGVLCGGVVGYLLSVLLYRQKQFSLGANRPVMAVLGAALGVLVALVAFRGGDLALGEMITTPEQFRREVVASDKPVVVDFYATWCAPCRRMMPILAKLEKEYDGRIEFYRVDVDQAELLAANERIRGVPTLLLYSRGAEVGRIVGGKPEGILRERFDALLTQSAGAITFSP